MFLKDWFRPLNSTARAHVLIIALNIKKNEDIDFTSLIINDLFILLISVAKLTTLIHS